MRQAGLSIVVPIAAGLLALPATGASQAPPAVVPEDEAWVLFFLVMRTMPPPHWDFATKVNYLKPSGLSEGDVFRIVRAADEYFRRTQPLDDQIRRVYQANPGRSNAPEVESQAARLREEKQWILRSVVSELKIQLSPADVLKLDDHIQTVRRQTRMWTPEAKVRVLSEKPQVHSHH